MPTTSPLRLNSGPPELPGFTATSVWMNGTRSSPGMERPVADTMPAVTLFSNVNGEPIASTHSPGRSFDGSPSFTTGSCLPSILMTATSVRLSTPMTFAGYSRRSVMRTVTSSASATTCAFVRM